ncbi:transposase [Budvicia diplopodorum]|uniref:transposase n=1 Tax=Budvicia diplopodorum TaxID=1119056 RepID=UPI003CCD1F79
MKRGLPDCPYCSEKRGVRKHGKARSGLQRYFCCECQKTFQVKYIYHMYKQKSEEQKLDRPIHDAVALSDVC